MRQNKKILVGEWEEKAKDDELNISSILRHRDGTPALVCFLSQQMAEKHFKALLVSKSGDFPKIHSLLRLSLLLEKYYPAINKELKREIVLLEPFYVGTRYPAEMNQDPFTWEKAEKAYKAAKKVKKIISKKLK